MPLAIPMTSTKFVREMGREYYKNTQIEKTIRKRKETCNLLLIKKSKLYKSRPSTYMQLVTSKDVSGEITD